jgi:hypothetical protein
MQKDIGSYYLHSDQDSIYKNVKPFAVNKEQGPKVGETIDFFKLYSLNNDSLDIALELSKGKPIFLISGSYTCPITRKEIHYFDSLAYAYRYAVKFFFIYTMEAHPHYPDLSPYENKLDIRPANLRDSIIYRQPQTYGQRKKLEKLLISKTKLKMPVFIDSPSNQWLNTYGALPNLAYLMDTSGKIKAKFTSFNNKTEIVEQLRLISLKRVKR